jgi:hypothetical protein
MTYTRKKRGGFTPASGTSAASYVSNNYGDQNSQFNRTMNSSGVLGQSNFLTPIGDSSIGTSYIIPKITGGRRKRKHSKKRQTKKKGGFFYEVVKQAIVPFSLLALNDATKYSKTFKSKRKYKFRK